MFHVHNLSLGPDPTLCLAICRDHSTDGPFRYFGGIGEGVVVVVLGEAMDWAEAVPTEVITGNKIKPAAAATPRRRATSRRV